MIFFVKVDVDIYLNLKINENEYQGKEKYRRYINFEGRGTHISFLVLRLKQVEEEYIVTTQLPVAIDEEFGLIMLGLLLQKKLCQA